MKSPTKAKLSCAPQPNSVADWVECSPRTADPDTQPTAGLRRSCARPQKRAAMPPRFRSSSWPNGSLFSLRAVCAARSSPAADPIRSAASRSGAQLKVGAARVWPGADTTLLAEPHYGRRLARDRRRNAALQRGRVVTPARAPNDQPDAGGGSAPKYAEIRIAPLSLRLVPIVGRLFPGARGFDSGPTCCRRDSWNDKVRSRAMARVGAGRPSVSAPFTVGPGVRIPLLQQPV